MPVTYSMCAICRSQKSCYRLTSTIFNSAPAVFIARFRFSRCPRQLSGNACEIDARVVRARALIAETPLRGGNGGSAEGARSMQASQQPLPAGAIASPPAAALAVCLIVVAVLAGMVRVLLSYKCLVSILLRQRIRIICRTK